MGKIGRLTRKRVVASLEDSGSTNRNWAKSRQQKKRPGEKKEGSTPEKSEGTNVMRPMASLSTEATQSKGIRICKGEESGRTQKAFKPHKIRSKKNQGTKTASKS